MMKSVCFKANQQDYTITTWILFINYINSEFTHTSKVYLQYECWLIKCLSHKAIPFILSLHMYISNMSVKTIKCSHIINHFILPSHMIVFEIKRGTFQNAQIYQSVLQHRFCSQCYMSAYELVVTRSFRVDMDTHQKHDDQRRKKYNYSFHMFGIRKLCVHFTHGSRIADHLNVQIYR